MRSRPLPSRPARVLAVVLLAIAAVWLVPRPSQADADGQEARVRAAIDEVLADPDLPTAFWGIVVRDAQTGRVVLSRNEDKRFLPASNLKILTTATALDALGPDYRYTTRLYLIGSVADSTLTGDLVIRGSGDPTFGSDGRGDPLSAWAEALADAGVRRVVGRIVGDDDAFEDDRYAEGWDVTHIASENYAPPSGGLVWNDNLVGIQIAGDGAGQPVRFESDPPGFATLQGDVRTGGRGRLDLRRTLGTDEFQLRGVVPTGYRGTIQVPVANPTLYAVFGFADRLSEAGIDVSRADLVDVDDLPGGLDYGAAEPVRVSVSPPLRDIIEQINRESDNLYAEQVFRTFGGGAVRAAGDRVQAFVTESGADGDALSVADGSGLSRKDLVTPASLAAVLRAMRSHPAGRDFVRSLPEGGGQGSTLRNRLGDVSVRAKTGSLESVRCLAGYVDGPDGTPYVFVLMANNYTAQSRQIAQAQDRIVRAIATGGRPPVDEE